MFDSPVASFYSMLFAFEKEEYNTEKQNHNIEICIVFVQIIASKVFNSFPKTKIKIDQIYEVVRAFWMVKYED